ncbi:MAG: hypothetical protein HY904_23745 [Deltaproteobacteria bacterium]|nr:hypothetical protein [Deltaproteobacteria bacterium]
MITVFRHLTPPAQDLLVEACGRFDAGQALALRRYFEGRPRAPKGETRQAAYGQLSRAVTTAIAGSLALATVDPRYHRLVLSNDFALLKAYCPSVYSRYDSFPPDMRAPPSPAIKRLIDDAATEMIHLSGLPEPLSRVDSVRAYSMAAVLAVTLVDHGLRPGIRDLWKDIFRRAEGAGALARPYFRAQFCYLGSFVGEWNDYVQWLMEPANRLLEEADLVCFSREDLGDPLYNCVAALVAGRPYGALDALHPARPEKTVTDILGFARGAAHRHSHFRTPGLVAGVLSWAMMGRDLAARLQPRRAVDDNEAACVSAQLRRGIAKVTEVLDQRGARFWQAMEEVGDQHQREFMLRCWATLMLDGGAAGQHGPDDWFFGRT